MSAQRLNKADVVTDFRRAQVIAAARERFSKHGLAGTTMDGIAQAAGVAKGTVYLYYKSKEDIFRQILDEDLANLQDDTVPLISGPGTIEDKLHAFFLGCPRLLRSQEGLLRARHLRDGVRGAQEGAAALRGGVQGAGPGLADAAGRCAARRTDRRGRRRAPARSIIVGAASGLAKQRLRGWVTTPVDDVATQAARTLWKGLAAR